MRSRALFNLSIDVESWIHGRIGTRGVLWPDARAGFREVYRSDRPGAELRREIDLVLGLLARLNVRATFFVLGEIACAFPDLVRELVGLGHEVALHGDDHRVNTTLSPEEFRAMVRRTRALLEDQGGAKVEGYRAPFLILDSVALAILEEEGFSYDSSVCPSRPLLGKYKNFAGAPALPYHPSKSDLSRPGSMSIVELPIPVFPGLRLPAGSSHFSRFAGPWWARIGVGASLSRGYGLFYFHPWEIAGSSSLPKQTLYLRLFHHGAGARHLRFIEEWVGDLRQSAEILLARDLATRVRAREVPWALPSSS